MQQKISAIKYIKNNKRRVAVLIISLSLSFVITYLTQFLLSASVETFKPIMLENTQKIQYMNLAGSSIGVDIDNPKEDEIMIEYKQKVSEIVEKLKGQQGIEHAFYTQIVYSNVTPPIGGFTIEIPLVEKEEIMSFIKHMDAKIIEGRLPENEGEIVLDEASIKNNGYKLGDYFREDRYLKVYKIVGILDCDNYFGCGIPSEKNEQSSMIVTLSDGSIKDMSKVLQNLGVNVRETYDNIIDYKQGEKFLQEDVISSIDNATKYVYLGIMILLFISLFIVYVTYLRDRHNEWCLYCSIGYSRKTIYLSIMRELLFTFVTAIIIGSLIILVSVVGLDNIMIQPMGLRCAYFYPKTVFEIICSYVLLFGILQIPIRYALFKIRTVDAMEDDLY